MDQNIEIEEYLNKLRSLFNSISESDQNKIQNITKEYFPLILNDSNLVYDSLHKIELNKDIYIDGLDLPQLFSKQSNENILQFLKDRQVYGQIKKHRLRVMVVGPGAAGKTTLINRLTRNQFIPIHGCMTEGVEMQEWKLEIPEDNEHQEIDILFWDFGGQEIYLNTHPILFSEKTLYLLMWNPRVEKSTEGYLRVIENYCVNIRSRAPNSPMIIATSHSAEAEPEDSTLQHLKQYNYMGHYKIDSQTGKNIDELKRGLHNLILTDEKLKFSRLLIPKPYNLLEEKIMELRTTNFSITQQVFRDHYLSTLQTLSNSTIVPEVSSDIIISHEISRSCMDLFHQWGIIFTLPNNGDIVLNPYDLSRVFSSIITCHSDAIKRNEVFHEGVLDHNKIGEVWDPRYSHLHDQFLSLLHKSDLAYELFDEDNFGNRISTKKSLIPALLTNKPEHSFQNIRIEKEEEFRNKVSNVYGSLISDSDSNLKGCIIITFKYLVSNFFPKLMVRHHSILTKNTSLKNSFFIELNEWDNQSKSTMKSYCCIIEMRELQSLILIPYGRSPQAITIAIKSIRSLLDNSFEGIDKNDLFLQILTDSRKFSKTQIYSAFEDLNSPNAGKILYQEKDKSIQLDVTYLSPMFPKLDRWSFVDITPCLNLPLSQQDQTNISRLYYQYNKYNHSNNISDKILLSFYAQRVIPIFREYCLNISRESNILWLILRSLTYPRKYYCIGITPNPDVQRNWEIVTDSKYTFEISEPLSSSTNQELRRFSPEESLWKLLKKTLKILFGVSSLTLIDASLSNMEWLGYFNEVTSLTTELEEQLKLLETAHYFKSENIFEEVVYYSKKKYPEENLEELKVSNLNIPIFDRITIKFNEVYELRKKQHVSFNLTKNDILQKIDNEFKLLILSKHSQNEKIESTSGDADFITYHETDNQNLIEAYQDSVESLNLIFDRINKAPDLRTLLNFVKKLETELDYHETKEFQEFKEKFRKIDTINLPVSALKEKLLKLIKDILDFIDNSINKFNSIKKTIKIKESINQRLGDKLQQYNENNNSNDNNDNTENNNKLNEMIERLESFQNKVKEISNNFENNKEENKEKEKESISKEVPLLFIIQKDDDNNEEGYENKVEENIETKQDHNNNNNKNNDNDNDKNNNYSINFLCSICGNTPIPDRNKNENEENNSFTYKLNLPDSSKDNPNYNWFYYTISKLVEISITTLHKKDKLSNLSLVHLRNTFKYLKEVKKLELVNIQLINSLYSIINDFLDKEKGNENIINFISSSHITPYSKNKMLSLLSSECCDDPNANSKLKSRSEISIQEIKLIKLLFVLLGDDECEKCGLKKVKNEETGEYFWICEREECHEKLKHECEGDEYFLY